jgi:putative molybdopterin biosynthesis protein
LAKIFHNLLSIEEAQKIIGQAVDLKPKGKEKVDLINSLGRVLAEDVFAPIDSPPFDRSEVDGFAVSADDVSDAEEGSPAELKIIGFSEVGKMPTKEIHNNECMSISTGAPLPKGADSVVMVEYTKEVGSNVYIYRSIVHGENIAQAGSDYVLGDLFLRKGVTLTSREIASLSALGFEKVIVYRRPKIGLFSSGNEVMKQGKSLIPGKIYDANGPAICSMISECGGEPYFLGILPDTYDTMLKAVSDALNKNDMVLTSGSTSAGLGDIMYRVFDSIGRPGVVVHGLKIKPGKPTIVAVAGGKLLFGLPGFPVSAMMVFTALVVPVLKKIGGYEGVSGRTLTAKVPFRIFNAKGKRSLIPVSVIDNGGENIAYPTPGSSGSVSTLNYSDGFIDIPENIEFIEENEDVCVSLFSDQLRIPDLNIIGSHCPAVELILSLFPIKRTAKIINLGSLSGWNAIKKKEADIAGTHLLDEDSLQYNIPFLNKFNLKDIAVLVKGYKREQGIITLKENQKRISSIEDMLKPKVTIINRNKGSGTRTFFDYALKKIASKSGEDFNRMVKKINGYNYEAKTHSAVALAVVQGRADAGVGLRFYAEKYGLGFTFLTEEEYDFVVLRERLKKPGIEDFIKCLRSKEFQTLLPRMFKGYSATEDTGKIMN